MIILLTINNNGIKASDSRRNSSDNNVDDRSKDSISSNVSNVNNFINNKECCKRNSKDNKYCDIDYNGSDAVFDDDVVEEDDG